MKKRIIVLLSAVIFAVGGIAVFLLLRNKPVQVDYSNMPADLIAAAVGHTGIDPNYETDDYSLVYNNADGTKTMYVYTHPVRYMREDGNYQIIDNALVPSDFGWQNKSNDIRSVFTQDKLSVSLFDQSIQISFPKSEPALGYVKTILGNKQEAIQYPESGYTLSCYPTYLGTKIQLDMTKPLPAPLQFGLDAGGLIVDTDNAFYIDFQNEKFITAALIYQPIIKDGAGNIRRLLNALQYNDGKLDLDLTGLEDLQYPLCIEFTLNMYKKKQADSSVMSGQPNTNQYLDDYLYVGYFDDLGEAESLIRFETSLYKSVQAAKVLSAEYQLNSMTTLNNTVLQIHECEKEWASTKVTWNTRDSYPSVIGDVQYTDTTYYADITGLVKKWIDGNANSHFGFQITGNGGTDGAIFPSADNGYCSPRLVVRFE